MDAKNKAVKLVKISFERIALASNYKGVINKDDKGFKAIENLSKEIALELIEEIIDPNQKSNYWKEVKSEINKL